MRLNPLRSYRDLKQRNARDLVALVADGTLTPLDAKLLVVSCRGGFRYMPDTSRKSPDGKRTT